MVQIDIQLYPNNNEYFCHIAISNAIWNIVAISHVNKSGSIINVGVILHPDIFYGVYKVEHKKTSLIPSSKTYIYEWHYRRL